MTDDAGPGTASDRGAPPAEMSLQLSAVPESVRRARGLVVDLTADAGFPQDLVDSAALVLSEVVTNAVVHGRAPISLRAEVAPTRLRVEIHDGAPDRVPSVSEVSDRRLGGRGLPIVAAVASTWGCDVDVAGKTVWFTIER